MPAERERIRPADGRRAVPVDRQAQAEGGQAPAQEGQGLERRLADLPAALLAEVEPPRPASFSVVLPAGGQTPPAEEIAEVHVSIGRVDIVAPPEPARPSARPPVKPKGLSLDDYLAGKRGGAG